MLHKELQGSHLVIDMSLDDFIEVIKRLYVYDIELHESTYAV